MGRGVNTCSPMATSGSTVKWRVGASANADDRGFKPTKAGMRSMAHGEKVRARSDASAQSSPWGNVGRG